MEAERRQITVLFADMVGFTTFSDRAGEEAAFALMSSLRPLMDDAVREQGGVVQVHTGDGIMAVFGAPAAFEDAPLYACRAGLSILQRLQTASNELEVKHGIRPQLRIGINTGLAVFGTLGSGTDAAATVTGDTVNFASRLQALAAPDSVCISEATYRLLQARVEATFAGEQQIKGKSKLHKVYRLDAIRHGAGRFDASISRGLTPFVGRERELEALERGLREARSHLRVVDIVAEPGMGKSRLLHEFRQRIGKDRALVLSGSCLSETQQTPFFPFIEVMRSSFGIRAGEAEKDVAQKLEMGLKALGVHSVRNLGLLLHLLGLQVPDGAQNFPQDAKRDPSSAACIIITFVFDFRQGQVITGANRGPGHSGKFFNHTGREYPWWRTCAACLCGRTLRSLSIARHSCVKVRSAPDQATALC